MDIVKTLVRANALLLQGAYQGAETVLDSAIVEARELVAENARLKSIIDEANAQPVSLLVKFDANGEFVTARRNQVGLVFDCDASYLGYYARPIPAQQVPDAIKLLQRVAASTTESIASQWITVCDAESAFESYLETFGGPDTNAWHDAPVDGVFKDGFNRGLLSAQQSVDRDTIINVLLSIGNMSEGIIADAIIGAISKMETTTQPSPAVAVPELIVEVLRQAVMVVAYRDGDVSTEDGERATTDTDSIIRLESALCEALGTKYDDIDLAEAIELLGKLPVKIAPKPQKCCSFWRNDAIENAALIAERYAQVYCAQDIRNMKRNDLSPRITDQDAREIAKSLLRSIYRVEFVDAEAALIDSWLRKDSSITLLNKLNGDCNGQ